MKRYTMEEINILIYLIKENPSVHGCDIARLAHKRGLLTDRTQEGLEFKISKLKAAMREEVMKELNPTPVVPEEESEQMFLEISAYTKLLDEYSVLSDQLGILKDAIFNHAYKSQNSYGRPCMRISIPDLFDAIKIVWPYDYHKFIGR